jgi:hypothetical protein
MDILDVRVGQRVQFRGNSIIPPVIGTVERIWPKFEDDDKDYPGAVTMRPDVLPENWPYSGTPFFAPWVNDIEPIAAAGGPLEKQP